MNVFAILSETGKQVYTNECDDKCEKAYPRGCFLCIDCGVDVFVRRGKLQAYFFFRAQLQLTDGG